MPLSHMAVNNIEYVAYNLLCLLQIFHCLMKLNSMIISDIHFYNTLHLSVLVSVCHPPIPAQHTTLLPPLLPPISLHPPTQHTSCESNLIEIRCTHTHTPLLKHRNTFLLHFVYTAFYRISDYKNTRKVQFPESWVSQAFLKSFCFTLSDLINLVKSSHFTAGWIYHKQVVNLMRGQKISERAEI